MILALRTDKPVSELYLIDPNGVQIADHNWTADRQLADTILPTIETFLQQHQQSFRSLTGLIIFTGQGSFTGLRIGTTVANTLAYSLSVPIVAAGGGDWIKDGFSKLQSASPYQYITPDYETGPNITQPRKS